MNKPIIIDGCNVVKERKFLIHTDKYSIGEDGLIDNTIPLTDICYELALQLQRLKAENEQLKTKIFDEGLRRKTCKYYKQVCSENTQLIAYRNALDEVKQLLTSSMDINLKSANKHFSLIDEAIEKVNEVLKDENH